MATRGAGSEKTQRQQHQQQQQQQYQYQLRHYFVRQAPIYLLYTAKHQHQHQLATGTFNSNNKGHRSYRSQQSVKIFFSIYRD
jgi:hypothetical protein